MMSPHAVHRRQLEDAQDDRRGRGVHPGAAARASSTVDGVDVALCAAVHRRCRPMVDSTRGSRVAGLRAEHAPGATTGAFTGEVSAPMLTELDVARRRARPLRAARATSARPTARWQQKVPAALDAGLTPILCVGETEEEREARRHRAQAAPPGPGGPREGRRPSGSATSSIAYEPIWAIGTGLRRHARAGPGGDRLRPRAGRRPRPRAGRAHADPLRRLRQARQRGRAAGAARRRRRARRRRVARRRRRSRRSSTPRRGVAAVTAVPSRLPRRARRLGAGARRARATPSRWPTRRCSTSCGQRYPHTQLTACGRRSGLPEGQMGNSEVGHLNLGAGAVVKQDLTRIDEAVEDGALAENEVLRAAFADAAARAPDRARVRRRRALRLEPPRGADRAGAPSAASPTSSSTPSPTGATRCPTSGAGYLEQVAGLVRARPAAARDRLGHRPLLRDGPRQALGPHRRRPTTCSCTAAPSTTPTAASRRPRAAYERDETDEFISRTTVGDEARIRPGDSRHRLQLPPRPHARDHARAGRAGLRRGRPRRRRAGRALRDADRVRGGLALPGRLPARAPRDHARRTSSPRAGGRQLHVAETEKYPHVTYFFGGGEEEPVRGRAARARALAARRRRPTTRSPR